MSRPTLPPRPRSHRPSTRPSIFALRSTIFASLLGAVSIAQWDWALRWFISGTPLLTLCLIIGSDLDLRVLPMVPLWTLITTLNLTYAVCATSWLLFWVFTGTVYPAIFFTCLFQFDPVSRLVRRSLRKALTELHFVNDIIALFDIPALEINVDVDGLMVVRGLTIQLSSLTVIAHGVEVGIKLAEDIELAISTEKVIVYLFRRVEVGDCYANVKGGQPEMTFGDVELSEEDEDGDAVMVEATPLLQAAAQANKPGVVPGTRPKMVKMTSRLTNGVELDSADLRSGFKSMRRVSPEDTDADKAYTEIVKSIHESNSINQCRKEVMASLGWSADDQEDTALRAAICSAMQKEPSVPHPPRRSIKVTTLQNLSRPSTRRLMHRCPMLLRLILNPIAYFHPVYISSITAGGSGRWISFLLHKHLFKDYSEGNRQLKKLEKRILAWLADANFVLELGSIEGQGSVPFISTYDIKALLKFADIIAYRTAVPPTTTSEGENKPDEDKNRDEDKDKSVAEQVVRLGGADATFSIPSYLLPHHEHLLPPLPTRRDIADMDADISSAEGKPAKVQAEHAKSQVLKDVAEVELSAHVQLPAVFSQDLLNFIAALVKATKVVEMEKDPHAMEGKISGFKEFGQALSKGMKDSMKRTVVDGIISDKWIAKMVGKVTRKLEEAQGDLGYSGGIPVDLGIYRLPEGHPEAKKILA